MREIITHTETIQKEKIVAITCNCCGKTVEGDHVEYASDIETWEHDFGYGSRFDMDRVSMDICDDCYANWIKTFVHPPQKNTAH
ncbi:MAG: hypothetical protein DRH57_05500 [Candidatus Cloacimonadota bacterium]|nr:MAG: hypothetical protein DRH57_05500 [Candidatus Cloacimonadota bacterium]